MRKPLFSSLARYAGLLILAAFLAAGCILYVSVLIPGNTAVLNERYFRVLASVADDLRTRAPIASAIEQQQQEGTLCPLGYAELHHLLDQQNLRRREVFRYFFIVNALPDQLVAAGPTDVAVSASVLDPPWALPAAATSGSHADAASAAPVPGTHPTVPGNHTTVLSLNGEDYQLFVLPVRLTAGTTWLLGGAVPLAELNRERRELPPGWSITLLGLGLLGLLALPFLKLALMSNHEQLERSDIARCAAAMVLGSGILLVTAQSMSVRYYTNVLLPDEQLHQLAANTARGLDSLVRGPAEPPDSTWAWFSKQLGIDSLVHGPAEPPDSARARFSRQLGLDSLVRGPAGPPDRARAWFAGQLQQPTLPPGFGLCVVDTTGRLLYQADTLLRHSENLRQDCANFVVSSALVSRLPATARVVYQGHPTRLQLYPLAQRPYLLAAYFDLNYSTSHRFQAWVMTLTLLGGYWLLLLVFCCFVRLLVRRSDRWPLSRDSLRHFWPNRGYAFRYWQLVLALLVALTGVLIAGLRFQPLAQLYLLLVIPIQLYLITFRLTRLRRSAERKPLRQSLTVVIVALLLLSGAYAYCISALSIFLFDVFQLAIPLLLWGLLKLNFWSGGVLRWYRFQTGLQYRWPRKWVYSPLALMVTAGLVIAFRAPPDEVCGVLAIRLAFSLLLWALWFKAIRRPAFPIEPASTPATFLDKAYSLVPRFLRRGRLLLMRSSLRAYCWMLTGWVLLLGLAPAQMCYHIGRLTEQLYELRYAQRTLLAGPPSALINPDFFYDTRRDSTREASLTTDSLSGRQQNLRWLAYLHPDTEPLLRQAATLLPAAPVSAGADSMHLSSLAVLARSPRSTVLLSYSQATNTAYWSTLRDGNWERLWLYYLPLAGLLFGLFWLVNFLAHKVFVTVSAPPTHLPEDPSPATGQVVALPNASDPAHGPHLPHHYWLLPSGSDWQDVPHWTRHLFLSQPDARPFDCRRLFTSPLDAAESPLLKALLEQLTDTVPGPHAGKSNPNKTTKGKHPAALPPEIEAAFEHPPGESSPHLLILTHFDYRHDEAAITAYKCQLLTALLAKGWQLLLVANIHPAGFSGGRPPGEKPHDAQARRPASSEALLHLLGDFRLQYFSLAWRTIDQPASCYPAAPNRQVRKLACAPGQTTVAPWTDEQIRRAEKALFGLPDTNLSYQHFLAECRAFPFVQALRADIVGALWRQRSPTRESLHAYREYQLAQHRQQDSERDLDVAALHYKLPELNGKLKGELKEELSAELEQTTQPAEAAITEARSLAAQHYGHLTKDELNDADNQLSQIGRWEEPKPEEVADTIRRLSWLHFRRQWQALSLQEQFLLFDLAYDGLVNTNNRHHLHNLLHKGLLRRDDYGRLHVASDAFQSFIIAEQRRPDALRYAEQNHDDLWTVVRSSLVLLITVAALLVVFTQPGPFLNPQRLLALVVAFVPQLNFLLKRISGSGPATD